MAIFLGGLPDTMTLKKFYAELNKTKSAVQWYVGEFNQIRGTAKNSREGLKFCPLTAVAYYSKGVYLKPWEGFSITIELGMEPDDASRVLMAADGCSAYPSIRNALEQILFGVKNA